MQTDYALGSDGTEILSAVFRGRLRGLNEIILATGAPLEGNLFYFQGATDLADCPDPARAHKRRNLYRAIQGKHRFLEVGFNAGHSALLALSAAPDLTYLGVDIASNPYTRLCAALMSHWFGDRFLFVAGDSREMLPAIWLQGGRGFDLIHVDGGHGAGTCLADLVNAVHVAEPAGAHLLLDDTGHAPIRALYERLRHAGLLQTDDCGRTWEGGENLLARVLPRGA
ncbi:MAG: class I SAM-dependent methyltransferase [Alphaproteobacteria bacterium]